MDSVIGSLRRSHSIREKASDVHKQDSKLSLLLRSGAEVSKLPEIVDSEANSGIGELSRLSTPAIDNGSPVGRSRASKQVCSLF